MAITPFVTYDDLGNPVDSRKMAAGWSGKHNGIHAPASFESFSAAGTIKIGTATTAVASASSVGFKVVRRDQDGTLTDMATGIMPSGAVQRDASDLTLSVTEFPSASPSSAYAVVPNGTLAPSVHRPGFFTWVEAPADGFGLNVDLIMVVQ